MPNMPAMLKTNDFPVMRVRVPDQLLERRRTDYGWEELQDKGDSKMFTRAQITNARTSAFAYGKSRFYKIASVPVRAGDNNDGDIITEKAYFNKAGKEITIDSVPETIRGDVKKMKKAGYTVKDVPQHYLIIRTTSKKEAAELKAQAEADDDAA